MPVSRKRTKAKSRGAGARSGDPRKAAQQKQRAAAKVGRIRAKAEKLLSDVTRDALEKTGFPVSDAAWEFYSDVREDLEAKLRNIFTGPCSLIELEDKELLTFATADKFRSLRMKLLHLTEDLGKSTADPEVKALLERCLTLKTLQNLMLRGLMIDEDIKLAHTVPAHKRVCYDEVAAYDLSFLEMMNTYVDVRYTSHKDKLPLSCPELDEAVMEMADKYDDLMASGDTPMVHFEIAMLMQDYCQKIEALKDTFRKQEEEQGCSLREMYHFELKQDGAAAHA